MTVCNMSIEAGAKAGLIAPDETTFEYLEGAPRPEGARGSGRSTTGARCVTDDGATFDKEVVLDAAASSRTSRGAPTPARSRRSTAPSPTPTTSPTRRARRRRPGARVHGPRAGTPMRDVAVDTVFIGSCTNSRIEDLRAAAAVAEGRTVADGVRTLVVPGSHA
jgi:3-isopropylmalate/(R)-2-methylmalate dehydratase large subunit